MSSLAWHSIQSNNLPGSSYSKEINDDLSVSVKYLEKDVDDGHTDCVIEFRNTSTKRLVINPNESQNSKNGTDNKSNSTKGWLGGIFKGVDDVKEKDVENYGHTNNSEVSVFLGYVQLFGYLVLNYKLATKISDNFDDAHANSSWWANKDYLARYHDQEDSDTEDKIEREAIMDTIPLVKENITKRLIIGGNIGGVSDLHVDFETNTQINESARYFLHDLIYAFNSYERPNGNEESGLLPFQELVDSIVPIYTTSQTLLFTDISIAQGGSRSFHIRFPTKNDLPPTYNAVSTGPLCDQGLVSIRYSLILGFSSSRKVKPIAIYFPYEMTTKIKDNGISLLQKDYLTKIKVDKIWQASIVSETESKSISKLNEQVLEDEKRSFLEDLSNLITADLHHLPHTSTAERKRSVNLTDGHHEPGFISQLPSTIKNQFRVKINSVDLCNITLSKLYYNIGDDIYFVLSIPPKMESLIRVAGFIVGLEAEECFHIKDEKRKEYKHKYRVTPGFKFNTFSPSTLSCDSHAYINGKVSCPNYLTHQFQSSTFMNLRYLLVFKILYYESEEEECPNSNGESNISQNGHENLRASTDLGKERESSENQKEERSSIWRTSNEVSTSDEIHELSEQSGISTNHNNNNEKSKVGEFDPNAMSESRSDLLEKFDKFRFYCKGKKLTISIPVYILP